MDTHTWIKDNYGQVEAIIRYKYWFMDKDVYRDVAQYVCYRMCKNNAISRYDESKGTFRVYLYTLVLRMVDTYLKVRTNKYYDPIFVHYVNNEDFLNSRHTPYKYAYESDMNLDVEKILLWIKGHTTDARYKMLEMQMEGYKLSEIATLTGVSRQRVDRSLKDLTMKMRRRYAAHTPQVSKGY